MRIYPVFNKLTTVNQLSPTPVLAAALENDCCIDVPERKFCLGNKASQKTDPTGPIL